MQSVSDPGFVTEFVFQPSEITLVVNREKESRRLVGEKRGHFIEKESKRDKGERIVFEARDKVRE